jgi:hypothetical protein
MRFDGISCDECRKTIAEPSFQVGIYFDETGKATSLEIAEQITASRSSEFPMKGYALLDICGLACLQKAVMRQMEKIQLGTSNGKHAEATDHAGGNA